MSSLVADYGTSSGESDSDRSDQDETIPDDDMQEEQVQALKLPKPNFDSSSSTMSVFSNPFTEAERVKKAILEKHVKMVPTKDKVQMINGKKICWNYRKGRCRFGHNCTFAHDSDLQKSKEDLEIENQIQSTLLCESSGGHGLQVRQPGTNFKKEEPPPPEAEDDWESKQSGKRKRPGLTPGIVPSKKVMKQYKRLKAKDKPNSH